MAGAAAAGEFLVGVRGQLSGRPGVMLGEITERRTRLISGRRGQVQVWAGLRRKVRHALTVPLANVFTSSVTACRLAALWNDAAMSTAEVEREHRYPKFKLHHRMQLALEVGDVGVQEMADYLGVSRASVSRWINGRGIVGKQTLRLWALRTGVALEWLEGEARPEGLEPPTFWSVVSRAVRRVSGGTGRAGNDRGAASGPAAPVYDITTGRRVA